MFKLKLSSLVLFVSFFMLNPSLIFAASPTLSLSPTSGTYNKGCTFSVNINIDTASQYSDGSDATLFYDPTRLNVVTITKGSAFPTAPNNIFDNQKGQLTVNGLINPGTPFVGTGLLATVNFQVLAGAPAGVTQVKFDFDTTNKTKTNDSNIVKSGEATDMLDSVIDGTFTVGSGSCAGQALVTTQAPLGGDSITVEPTLPQSGTAKTTTIITIVAGAMTFLGLLGALFFNHH